ncbi:MAG: CBS domain-containing protein [Candidatus Asgardarchaeia archaeon]
MKELKVVDVMRKGIVTVPHTLSVKQAAEYMTAKLVSGVIVTRKDYAIGIVTEQDIVRRVVAQGRDPMKTTVEEIMTTPLKTIYPEISLNDAAQLMVMSGIKKMPVIDREGNLVGMLSHTDLLAAYPGYVDLLREYHKVSTGEEI